ncbi:MAG: hypothetical protein H6Q33_5000, partial [Deltaproteobacteria bacterium]|nr:hypothetical protein [Deltaproteobacteria bacterium]
MLGWGCRDLGPALLGHPAEQPVGWFAWQLLSRSHRRLSGGVRLTRCLDTRFRSPLWGSVVFWDAPCRYLR